MYQLGCQGKGGWDAVTEESKKEGWDGRERGGRDIGRGFPVRVEDHPPLRRRKRDQEKRGGGRCITGMMNDPQVA